MIRKIAKDYNVLVNKVKMGDKFCEANGEETYINTSYSAGNTNDNKSTPEIWVGIFENNEYRQLSFLVELGRITMVEEEDEDEVLYAFEKRAIDAAYDIADKYEIRFSKGAKAWATRQLNSLKETEKETTE